MFIEFKWRVRVKSRVADDTTTQKIYTKRHYCSSSFGLVYWTVTSFPAATFVNISACSLSVQSRFCTHKSCASQSCQGETQFIVLFNCFSNLFHFSTYVSRNRSLLEYSPDAYIRTCTHVRTTCCGHRNNTAHLKRTRTTCDKMCPMRFVILRRKLATSREVQYTPAYFAKSRSKRHDIQYKEHTSNNYVGS